MDVPTPNLNRMRRQAEALRRKRFWSWHLEHPEMPNDLVHMSRSVFNSLRSLCSFSKRSQNHLYNQTLSQMTVACIHSKKRYNAKHRSEIRPQIRKRNIFIAFRNLRSELRSIHRNHYHLLVFFSDGWIYDRLSLNILPNVSFATVGRSCDRRHLIVAFDLLFHTDDLSCGFVLSAAFTSFGRNSDRRY